MRLAGESALLRGRRGTAFVGPGFLGDGLIAKASRTDDLYGVATGLYNRADHAEGLMIGLFNKAHTLRGVQIGLLNHVASGPAAARWLPLINARF